MIYQRKYCQDCGVYYYFEDSGIQEDTVCPTCACEGCEFVALYTI